ncbi:MAG: serine/threonine-protein kinase [Pirellulaceae bacterium]
MSNSPDDRGFSDFVSIAIQQCTLTAERAREIERLAAIENITPWQFGLEHGDFDLTDADIIKTMLNPSGVIEGYAITQMLGRGGMGVVYQARQLSLNREVALKTILLSQLSNSTAVKRFENEAQILASLTHPNIVTAFDFGRRDGRLFLAMELVRGKDVQRMIEHFGQLPEYLVWQILRQATSGLKQAATAGVIHRDIKPANLLLVKPPDGFPLPPQVPLLKIADFGLSTLADHDDSRERITSANVNVGSPIYMSPEQLESREIGAASDIFSLGATAWHMLVGAPPLSGLPLRTIIAKRLSEATPAVTEYRQGLSPMTADLLADMLHLAPAARISDYQLLSQRIDQVIHTLKSDRGEAQDTFAWMVDEPIAGPTASLPGQTTLPNSGLMETSELDARPEPLPTDANKLPNRKRKHLLLAIALPLALITGIFWAGRQIVRPEVVVRQYDAFGSRITMFDGQTLASWLPLGGSWSPGTDDEGGRILRGTDGTVAYDLGKLLDATKSSYFAIESAVDARGAAVVEFEFDLPPTSSTQPLAGSPDEARYVLQLADARIGLAIRRSLDELEVQHEISRSFTYPLLIRCERQNGFWWVFIDGEELGSVRGLHPTFSPRLQFSVRDGTASFSDITFVPAAN